MRLKIFFFPLVLIISVSIILLAIVPEWGKAKTQKEELDVKTQSLENITNKKKNAEILSSYVETKKDDVSFVDSYLPATQGEERAIDGINYIALNSGVVLGNIDVESVKADPIPVQENTGLDVPVMGSESLNADGTPMVVDLAPQVRYTRAKVNVIGTYESLLMFLGKLDNIRFFSKIKSLEIETENAGSGSSSATGTAVQQGSNILVADIVVDFGYLKKASVKDGYTNKLFEKSSFSAKTIDKLKDAVSKDIPDLSPSSGSKANPFAI
jgi:hypothetical protein